MNVNKSRDLERQVFGGSESELSSDEEDEPQLQPPVLAQLPAHDDQDQESSAGGPRSESEDDYVQQKPASAPGLVGKATKKKAKKQRIQGADPARIPKKRKRKQPVEIDLSELPPEQANKIRMDMKIDEILLRSKKSSRSRKKKSPAEVLDNFADDEVARLREAMNNAADEDMRVNQEKLPALAKLKMLTEVVDTLRKASLAQSIIDNNLLDAVRRFLEPLPDRSLPALSIQRELFTSLRKMEWIDSSALKESGLGRIVLFYTKCKKVEGDVSKVAKQLVEAWSRPIVGRSKEYRDRVVPVAGMADGPNHNSQGHTGKLTLASILARAKEEESRPGARRVRKNAVSIPQRELGTYVVAPSDELGLAIALGIGGGASQAGMVGTARRSVAMDVERRRKNAERLRSLTRKVAAGSSAAGGK